MLTGLNTFHVISVKIRSIGVFCDFDNRKAKALKESEGMLSGIETDFMIGIMLFDDIYPVN